MIKVSISIGRNICGGRGVEIRIRIIIIVVVGCNVINTKRFM